MRSSASPLALWRGGKSRWSWRRAGRPASPGRLCDLLHIIYRSADETIAGPPWSIRNLLRREILKENIDGEAVLWAAHRLRGRSEKRKILVVVSDGAPVDDSTLAANDPLILDRHLREVIASIEHASDIRLGAVGLTSMYPTSTRNMWSSVRKTTLWIDWCRSWQICSMSHQHRAARNLAIRLKSIIFAP